MEVVSEETAVKEHLPRVGQYARMMNGWGGAEYDDLYQEGSLKVLLLLREDKPVTGTAIKNSMLDLVRSCRRRGQAEPVEPDYLDIQATWEDRDGRQRTWWFDDGESHGGWTPVPYGPE